VITDYAAAQTVIRWKVANLYGGSNEMFKVDNVLVDVTGGGSDGFTNTACVDAIGGGITVSDCDRSTVIVIEGDEPPPSEPSIAIRKTLDGDQGPFGSGDTVDFRIEVENTGELTLTDVAVSDPLVPACDGTFASLAPNAIEVIECSTDLGAGSIDLHVEDKIDQAAGYHGGSGWSGPWVEFDPKNDKVNGVRPSQDPNSGRVVIGSNDYIWMHDYTDTGTMPSIQRSADLTDATSATLSFDWHTHNGVDHDDIVELQVSADGSTFVTVLELAGRQSGDKTETVDITDFISDTTTIRFQVVHKYGGEHETFKVNDVKIEATIDDPAEGFTNTACVSAIGDGSTVAACDSAEVVVAADDNGAGGGHEPVHIMLEAEDGHRSSRSKWRKKHDSDASGGRYLTPAHGENYLNAPSTSSKRRVTWNFSVDQAGDYAFWARVIAPSSNDDSLWVRIKRTDKSGINTGWIKWNEIDQGHNWAWDSLHDNANGNAPVEVWLETGDYELAVAIREDGIKLDAWKLTDDLTYNPNFN
jgi:hypothetical protein